MNRVFDLYALHVDRHIATMISRNIADAYLGGIAGAEVLEGAIRRGAGRAIEAVIWVSDLRGFSERADRLRPGVKVRVRKHVTKPHLGWGVADDKVEELQKAVGRIVHIDPDAIATVDFGKDLHPKWSGYLDEIESAQ